MLLVLWWNFVRKNFFTQKNNIFFRIYFFVISIFVVEKNLIRKIWS